MQPVLRLALLLWPAALLGGCGGDESLGGPGGEVISAVCETLVGDGATVEASVDPGCVECTVESEGAVADDSAYSYARVLIGDSLPEQGVVIRATGPTGTIYEAGSRAGVFFSDLITSSSGVSVNGPRYKLTTYLAGIPVEIADSNGFAGRSPNHSSFATGHPDLPHDFIWFQTLLPFDALEFTVYRSQLAGSAPAEFRIYEHCWDGYVE